MSELLGLQKGIVYGPIQSRRLGSSLGINLLPAEVKLCAFDCLYCQYGWTGMHTIRASEISSLPGVEQVLDAVRKALEFADTYPSYITFSGNGEPTLHPDFPAIVKGVSELRDRYSKGSKTAILSNSATASDERIREALSELDVRIMKLDCGTEELFRRFNRPCEGVDFEAMINGLSSMKDITIQSLFAGGEMGNSKPEDIEAWVEVLSRIKPSMVQIYSLARGYPSRGIEPIGKQALLAISRKAEGAGIKANVF